MCASRSVQGRHKRTVRENSQHAKPRRSSCCRLLASDNDMMEGFQALHKGEGEEKIFLLWRNCPETSCLVLSITFPLQICRKSTSFTAFFEQWCSQLKSKLSFSYTETLSSSVHHAPWKPPGGAVVSQPSGGASIYLSISVSCLSIQMGR